MKNWRMFDQYAHRAMPVEVKGAAVDAQGKAYLFVSRTFQAVWPEGYGGVITTMLMKVRDGLWHEISATSAFSEGMTGIKEGERLRAGRRILSGVCPDSLVPERLIVVREPPTGWGWRKRPLTPDEVKLVAYNQGAR